MQNQYPEQQYADLQYMAQAAQAAIPPSPSSIAVHFRLHPASEGQSQAMRFDGRCLCESCYSKQEKDEGVLHMLDN
ncbi:uncharacterized protein LY89DRAFT_691816 [Mollisia scopiformis]|uniref:Uncharacterized protein n=1 Tax=Mollisia scopiformis TaxID=149040 RepID=A0A132B4M3_MOLSC|nr:uncharacterized protein LY89DRAFT_691816 [Mollisia scopiformis]KUJ07358.1 hypothetical protein LY89DRAFT_691816 [Mollisia scopiformis]